MTLPCTSHDISVNLAMHGYPQPAPAVGQFWWGKYGDLYVVQNVFKAVVIFTQMHSTKRGRPWMMGEVAKEFTFAPTLHEYLYAYDCDCEAIIKLSEMKRKAHNANGIEGF